MKPDSFQPKELSVSIVLATYNALPYIQEQLDSIANQSRLPEELILSDDGSSDGTLEVLSQFLKVTPIPTRLIVNETNKGYRQNFFDALGEASCDITLFCDQDDIWHSEKINILSQLLTHEHAANVVIHNYEIFNDETVFIENYFAELNANGKQPADSAKGCAMGFRTVFLRSLLPSIDIEYWSHDTLILLLGILTDSLIISEQRLIKHRIHDHNTSGRLVNKVRWPVSSLRKASYYLLGEKSRKLYAVAKLDLPKALSIARAIDNNPNIYKRADGRDLILERIQFLEGRMLAAKEGEYSRFLWAVKTFIDGKFSSGNGLMGFLEELTLISKLVYKRAFERWWRK